MVDILRKVAQYSPRIAAKLARYTPQITTAKVEQDQLATMRLLDESWRQSELYRRELMGEGRGAKDFNPQQFRAYTSSLLAAYGKTVDEKNDETLKAYMWERMARRYEYLYEQAQHAADHDRLTGLPNAKALFEKLDKEISRAERTGSPLWVVVTDLDGFKSVNDRLGHVEGNNVLKKAAGIYKGRGYDYVARMGGDEFVMLIPESEDVVNAYVDRVVRDVSELGEDYQEHGIKLGVSCGFAAYRKGMDVEALLAEADRAMYEAKLKNKGLDSREQLRRVEEN